MGWFEQSEREKWATPAALSYTQQHMGLPALDERSQDLYGRALPRGVLLPRFVPDRPPVNHWMSPYDLAQHAFLPGQIVLGKFAGSFLGHLDDRPMVTIAAPARARHPPFLSPTFIFIRLDAGARSEGRACENGASASCIGHDVYVLDPFGQSGEPSACFNALAELDPESWTIVDDVASITQALIVDDDPKSRHWNESARKLLSGIVLLT